MTANPPFRRVCVVGVGLLGGSVALGLRRSFPGLTVVGVDRAGTAVQAHAAGLLDVAAASLDEGLQGADLVVLATPVRSIQQLLGEVASRAGEEVLVTDVGSTKRSICATAAELPAGSPAFVGGHPMAGRARGGWQQASADLLTDAPWILCPVGPEGWEHIGSLELLVEGLGALPLRMEPDAHDRTVARLSHLPQLLAMALMELGAAEDLRAAGPAFRDMTRLAGSSSALWEDILATNADEVRAAAAVLDQAWRKLLDRCLGGDVESAFRRANELRARLDPDG